MRHDYELRSARWGHSSAMTGWWVGAEDARGDVSDVDTPLGYVPSVKPLSYDVPKIRGSHSESLDFVSPFFVSEGSFRIDQSPRQAYLEMNAALAAEGTTFLQERLFPQPIATPYSVADPA